MIFLIYQLLLSLGAVIYFPLILLRAFAKKEGKYFWHRLGFGLKQIKKRGVGGIWFHAVSVGETKALEGLIKLFKEKYPVVPILISSQTDTGYATAKKLYPDAMHFYMPFDSIFIMGPLLKSLCPKFLIFSETDWWYQLLREAKKQKCINVLVSAKISERSTSRYQTFKLFGKAIFQQFNGVICQNEVYKERFASIGCPEEKLYIGGNLKYDMEYPHHTEEENQKFRESLGAKKGEQIIVLGSSHHPEEELLLNRLEGKKIWLVPRHPARASSLKHLVDENVTLIDQMGVLLRCYECCDIAIVAGSFVEGIGGHNILEPSAYGKPVLFGPYMETQFELKGLVEKAGAGREVTLDELPEVLDEIDYSMGEKGQSLIKRLSGISEKTLNTISLLSTIQN